MKDSLLSVVKDRLGAALLRTPLYENITRACNFRYAGIISFFIPVDVVLITRFPVPCPHVLLSLDTESGSFCDSWRV